MYVYSTISTQLYGLTAAAHSALFWIAYDFVLILAFLLHAGFASPVVCIRLTHLEALRSTVTLNGSEKEAPKCSANHGGSCERHIR